MDNRWKGTFVRWLMLFGVGMAVLANTRIQAADSGEHQIFIPFTQKQDPKTSPTPDPTPDPQPHDQGGFFFNKQIKNFSADIQLDKNGGMHAAYAHFTPTADHPRAVYTFCTAGTSACADQAAWQSVQLSDDVREVQLQLTPDGKPRMMIVAGAENLGRNHFYAACDQNCADANSWTLTNLVTTYNANDVLDQDKPKRNFAIAPDGRIGYVYNNRNYQYAEPDLYGAYYATCASNCSDLNNWSEAALSVVYRGNFSFDYEIFRYQSLTFTSDSKPRFVSLVFALNKDGSRADDGLYYYGCDANCNQTDNWFRSYLLPTGGGSTPFPSWDLKLTSNNQPRVVIATGSDLKPDDFNHQLLYLWCDTDCFSGNTNWSFNRVVTETRAGSDPDLELTSTGQPRVAWIRDNGDLNYAWCNTNCESDSPAWQSQVVETEAILRTENPQVLPLFCKNDLWNGQGTALTLDAAGNPRITYDLVVNADCYYEDPTDPSAPPILRFEEIWRGVHLTYFKQP